MTAALEVRGLTKRFAGLVAAHAVDIRVEAGAVHGLIGPNGAGKTTVFNLISGLLRPSAGTVSLFGRDVTSLPAYRRARLGLGRLFQVPQLFPTLTVAEHLQVATSAAARPWVERLGLGDWLERRPPALPFGLRRKVELAMVLSTEPTVLLLDEPAAGLAPAEKAELAEIVRTLSREAGTTILLVEHDMAWTLEVVDRLTVMAGGQVIAEGEPLEVCRSAVVQEAYLGAASVPA
jgi:ABC-type branched-subunit amino acid transport system ATPase component